MSTKTTSYSGLDFHGNITSWGFCLEDCPFEPPSPSCLEPPPVPSFASFGSDEKNFHSSWFEIHAQEDSVYKLTNVRIRQHHPEWFYDKLNITDEVQIFTSNSSANFKEIYGTMPNGTIVNYTCPLGYVFNDSFNIFFEAVCQNWTWISSFNNASKCVRKCHVKS